MAFTRSSWLVGLVLCVGCGGAGASGSSSTPSPSEQKRKPEESIGAAAAAQGGLASLGGAGNREEGSTGTEVAMGASLRAEETVKATPVKLDGMLKEWHPRAEASEALSGKTSAELGVGVQYDDTKIFVAAEISDAKLARSSKHGDADDHVSMTLAFPNGRGTLATYEIGFWPGKPGENVGAVLWLSGPSKGQAVSGARLVEADVKGGVTFEAIVPWASFAEARTTRVGLRAAFRYHDGDGAQVQGVVGNGHGSAEAPNELPPLPTAPEQAIVDGLLATQNLAGEPPKIDVYSDLTGDDRKERISVFGKFFTICGPGYRGGHQFFWRDATGRIASLETRQVTGRAKDDIVVRRKFKVGSVIHEVIEVWSLLTTDEPTTLFSHQIGVSTLDGKQRLTNSVRVSPKEIEVSTDAVAGWDASTFNEPTIHDTEAILLPWGTVKSRTFRFDRGKFEKANEVTQAGAPAAASTARAEAPRDVPRESTNPPTPDVKRGSDLGKQVLDAYMRDSGNAAAKPRFDLEVHVDGDPRPERVLLVGRDIVVLGPGFKGGTGYARMTLSQFADEKDIAELTVRDITGDGAADIVVRGVRRVTSNAGDKMDIEGLFIYQVRSAALARVFSIETAREQAGKRIQGLVQFIPARNGRGFDIDARPGVAKGWTDKTYPFPEEKPGGSIEPLLLPWGATKNLRYAWNGSQFTLP